MLQTNGLVSKEEPKIENAEAVLEEVVEEIKAPTKKAKAKKE
jgi:hypothetical protein